MEMAETIAEAIHHQQSLICEAGTGTGKTFAYLVPAIMSGHKVIVSTGTKHLQDQLFLRDLPLVRQAIGRPVNVALLKGRANYLCLYKLKQAERDHRYMDDGARSLLTDIRNWSQATKAGELSELTHIPEDSFIRSSCISTRDNCLGQECDFYEDCFVFKARQHAIEADLTVVNHHLFLADMALKEVGYGELLPAADLVIFDEAHQLPELASQFFSKTLSSRQLLELLTDAKAAYFEEAADLPDFLALLDGAERAVRDLRLALPGEDRRIAWHDVRGRNKVMSALAKLMEKTHALGRLLDAFSNRGKSLDNCYRRLDGMLELLDAFNGGAETGLVQWIETRGRGFFFHQTPLDIAMAFQQRMQEQASLNIYTSATLSVNQTFGHFASQLGLDEIKARSWDSPFNFTSQSLLYLPPGLPAPSEEGFTERVVNAAIPVLELTRGRGFFLFTSHRALRLAGDLIKEKIDYPILVQGDAPRTELLETFRNTEHAVLLGTSSFWEGVDVKGQALSCVIIDKLPFAAPGDPVLSARLKQMQEQGKNPFMGYQVPEAVIALKQGIGRLLRDKNDYGVLMICDPRLKSRPYGKVFLDSLPHMEHTQVLSDVEKFFRQHEE